MVGLTLLGSCNKKREVSVDKLNQTIIESVKAEQKEDGKLLTVDTIFLNNTGGDNYTGELHGHVNDSTAVAYDLSVTDDGEDLSVEWTLKE